MQEAIVRLAMLFSELVSTKSRMLSLTCVGWLINWIRELSKTKSQKVAQEEEVEESVSHCMSGRLKSPTIMETVDGSD